MYKKIPVSIIVLTKNEEIHIRRCLESVHFADEVFVVDSGSSDDTKKIATELGAHTIDFKWNGQLPKKKNWCLLNLPIKNEWVIMLDADEEVPPSAIQDIETIVASACPYAAYIVRFNYFFLNKIIRHGDPVRKLIFFKHKHARFTDFDDYPDREVEGSEQPKIDGRIGIFPRPFIHRNLKGISEFFARHNAYSTRAAYLIYDKKRISPELEGNKDNIIIKNRMLLKNIFARLPFRPLLYFIYGYIIKLGFLDGKAGFYYNMCKAFYYFQLEVKLYEMRIKSR